MNTVVTMIHVLACFILILVVLLQAGKGANMGAAFGGSSQTVFGSSGAGTFLGKMTAVVAIIFMITSISLTYMVSRKGSAMLEHSLTPLTRQTIPAVPAPNSAIPAAVPTVPGK